MNKGILLGLIVVVVAALALPIVAKLGDSGEVAGMSVREASLIESERRRNSHRYVFSVPPEILAPLTFERSGKTWKPKGNDEDLSTFYLYIKKVLTRELGQEPEQGRVGIGFTEERHADVVYFDEPSDALTGLYW